MIIPTTEWNALGGTNGFGGFTAWDASDRDADDMVVELCTALADITFTDLVFDTYTIWTKASPTDPVIPRAANTLAITGTGTVDSWRKAVQRTFTFFDTAFNTFKLVCLDFTSKDLFSKYGATGLSVDEATVVTIIASVTNAWSSRAGLRPSILRSLATTINVNLRDSYVV
jgi:hypothetical protein